MPASASSRQVTATLAVVLPGLFLTALDQTIVATSIRTIADDLGGYSAQAWIATAYLITATVSTPLYGRLADRHGRRPLLVIALGLFLVGSILCAFAWSVPTLAGFRALQGAGAGGVLALSLVMVADMASARERAAYQGFLVGAYGCAAVIGPVLGGLLAGQTSILGVAGWRWVFLVNVPVAVTTMLTAHRLLSHPRVKGEHRIDWPGALLLPVGLVPLLVLVDRGHGWGWTSIASMSLLGFGSVGLLCFLEAERRGGRHALLPLAAFADRTFTLCVITATVVGFVMFGAIAIIPQYAQIVGGVSPTVAGLGLLPAVAGTMLGSVLCSRYIRAAGRFRPPAFLGALVLAAGSATVGAVTPDTPLVLIGVLLLGMGIGLGAMLQPVTIALQSVRRADELGASTATSTFFRQAGGAAGVSVFLAVAFARLPSEIDSELASAADSNPTFGAAALAASNNPDPEVADLARQLLDGGVIDVADSSVITRTDAAIADPLRTAFADAFTSGAPIAVVLALIAAASICFAREVQLPARTPHERRTVADKNEESHG